jgi:predicted acyltransferase
MTSHTQRRVLALDVLRGMTVIAMMIVNAAGVLSHAHGEVKVFDTFLHANWVGCTFADLVFPMFLFAMGVSISLSLGPRQRNPGLTWELVLSLGKRTGLLILIGLLLSLVVAVAQPGVPFLVLGVLQRIGIAFFLSALIFVATGRRVQIAIVVCLLAAYWPLVAWVPVPGVGAPDPMQPGLNFASWFDPALLGRDWVLEGRGPHPYDPEGTLPTLLACVPQVLIGALVGEWLRRRRDPFEKTVKLALAGIALSLGGWIWSFSLPLIKAVWTSSYVLWTSGIAMITLAALYYWIDVRGRSQSGWVRFCEGFGINALAAYVLHTLLLGLEVSPLASAMHSLLDGTVPAELASLPPILLVLLVAYVPIHWMYRRNVILKV